MLASAPSKGECALDYLYSWDNELPGMNRINIYPNLCSVLPYTQILDSHLSCTERLRRWGRPGLLLALQQQRHEPLKEDDLVVDFARSLLTEGSANSSTSLAGHVRAIKEKARMNRPEFPDLEEAPVFIREYVHSLFKLVSYTCYPIIVNVGRDVLSITLRSALPGKLELHELEIIGSRVWGINDFSKASADLLHRIQKDSRQVAGLYGTALCEEQLFEYAKTIEKRHECIDDASKPVLGPTFNATDEERKGIQLEAAATLIYNTVTGTGDITEGDLDGGDPRLSGVSDIIERRELYDARKEEEDEEKSGGRLTDTCFLSYLYSPSGDATADGISSGDDDDEGGGIVVGAKIWTFDNTVPIATTKCALDYLYSWDNGITGFHRLDIFLGVHSIIPYTQLLKPDHSCAERLQLWSQAGLFVITHQDHHQESALVREEGASFSHRRRERQSGMVGQLAREWAGKGSEFAANVSAVLERARREESPYVKLEEVPVFAREYVHAKSKQVPYTCRPITTNVGRDVLSITLRSVLPGKLELHELEIIGSRVWGINDFSKASADLLYRIQKGSRQVTGSYGTALCEEQLFEYAKTIEKLSMDDGRASKPTLPSTFSANEKKRKEQLKAVGALIYSILPWAKVSHM
ncbi:hypothetical protein FOL46_006094 [Perkinsus olseni]|uniref:Uncharacterized protein n=1 Tax=Perkinsus olseni TaxID=32597 RepID=A0A7J6LMQ3_PEROL|nr:hypothetical protein FOL46_006094 [Perkinsus olseni]